MQTLSTHTSNEFIRMVILKQLVLPGETGQDIKIFVLGEEIEVVNSIGLLDTGINYHISFIIYDGIKLFGRQTQEVTNFIGQ